MQDSFTCSFCGKTFPEEDIIIKCPKDKYFVCRSCSQSKTFDDYVKSKPLDPIGPKPSKPFPLHNLDLDGFL